MDLEKLDRVADACSKLVTRMNKRADSWDESKHPRGQPGNAGQFGKGGGGNKLETARKAAWETYKADPDNKDKEKAYHRANDLSKQATSPPFDKEFERDRPEKKKSQSIENLASKIKQSKQFEDRLEYPIDMLGEMYELDEGSAKKLQAMLHEGDKHYKPF